MPLHIGQKAPNFNIKTGAKTSVTLESFLGKKLLLYFYPRDNTPGCTIEACGFRDAYDQIKDLGAEILGVSRDSLASHEKFRQAQAIPFLLGSDPDETVCLSYDVIKAKKMYGKDVRGIDRSTFLIDEGGVVRGIWHNVSVASHVQEVLAALRNL